MKKVIILFSFIAVTSFAGIAQITVYDTLYPTQDALVNSQYSTTNFGQSEYFSCTLSNSKMLTYSERSFMQFDFGQIPNNAQIDSANLYLFGLGHTGQNISRLNPVTSGWQEYVVTYANQPGLSDDYISVPQSTGSYENYVLDIKDFVSQWVSESMENYGFALRLASNPITKVNGLKFGSRDHSDSTKHPYLIMQVTLLQVPLTKLDSSLNGATNLSLNALLTAYSVYKAESYQFEITNKTTGAIDTVTESGNFTRLGKLPAVYDKTYVIRVRAKVAGSWGSFGDTCSITTVKMTQVVPCDTTLLSYEFSGMTGSQISIAVPVGVTLLDTAEVNIGTVSVNLIDLQHAEYTVNSSDFILHYFVTAGCETFNKNTQNIPDSLQCLISGSPATIIDTFSVSSPWIVLKNNLCQNIQYNDGFINQPITRTYAFVNTGADFSGDLEFNDTLNVPSSISALRFDTIYAPGGATILSQTISDDVVRVKLGNMSILAGDTVFFQDVVSLIKCPDGVNSKTTFDVSYGCDGSSLCAHAEMLDDETIVYESPDDKPELNYTLVTKGNPDCYGGETERIIKIENTGMAAADSVYIFFREDASEFTNSTSIQQMTYQPLDSIVVYKKDSLGNIQSVACHYFPQLYNSWKIYTQEPLLSGDSLFFRWIAIFNCADTGNYSSYFNNISMAYREEFPNVVLMHACNSTSFENGIISSFAQNQYDVYAYTHYNSLEQNFPNYNAYLNDGDEVWYSVLCNNLNLMNVTWTLDNQNGFVFAVDKSRLQVRLDLEPGLEIVPDSILMSSFYEGNFHYIFPDSFSVSQYPTTAVSFVDTCTGDTTISYNNCGQFVNAYFAIPDSFYMSSSTGYNAFKYIATGHYSAFSPGYFRSWFDDFFDNFQVSFKLRAVCACSMPPYSEIKEQILFIPNDSCSAQCAIPLSDASSNVQIHCPGCLLPGWNLTDMEVKRVSFGFADNDNNNYPDSFPLQLADTTLAHYQNFLKRDTMRIRLTGITSDGGYIVTSCTDSALIGFSNVGFNYRFGQLALINDLIGKMEFLGAIGLMKRSGVSMPFILPASTGHQYSNGFALNLDIDTLQYYGVPSSYSRFWAGDSIGLTLRFSMQDNLVDTMASNPYFSIQTMTARLSMSGSPYAGIELKTDADEMVQNDPSLFLALDSASRSQLNYWCTGNMNNFGAVGADFDMPDPYISHYSAPYPGYSPCQNAVRFYASPEIGHSVYPLYDGESYVWNAFGFELRNLWMLDSIEVSFPDDFFDFDRVIFHTLQVTNLFSATDYHPAMDYFDYPVSDVSMTDSSVIIYPASNFDSLTDYIDASQYLAAFDETKEYGVIFIFKTKDCAPPSVVNDSINYYLNSYWSDFPLSNNLVGDTIITRVISGMYTRPSATLLAEQTGLLNMDMTNSTLDFTVQIYSDSNGVYNQYDGYYNNAMSDNTFIAIDTTGNFIVDSITGLNSYQWQVIDFTAGTVNQTGTVGNTALYGLGMLGYHPRQLNISGHYNCANVNDSDSVKIYYGWNCNGYPTTDIHDVCFIDSMWVKFNVLKPGLLAELDSFSTVNACDTLNYTLHITATGLGRVDSLLVILPLPGSFDYIPGSCLLTYGAATDTVPETITPDSVFFYPGALSLLNNFETSSCDLTFRIVPDCGFYTSTDEVELYTSGWNFCGNKIGPVFQAARPDAFTGLPEPDSLLVQIAGDTLSGCGDTAYIVVTVYNAASQSTSAQDYADVVLPAGFAWAGGDTPSGINGQTISFPVTGGTPFATTDTISFTITGVSGSGTYPLTAAVYSVRPLICADDTCYLPQAFAEDSDTTTLVVIALSVSDSVTNASCAAACNGNGTVFPYGLGPFTYQWSNGDNTATADSLCIGTWYATITDSNGCSITDTVAVTDGNTGAPDATFFLSTDSICLKEGDTLHFSCPDPMAESWFWDFGDGTTSTLQNPTHVYADFGYFCMNITASNICGNSSESELLYIKTADCPCDTTFDISNGWTVQSTQYLDYNTFGHSPVKVHGDIVVPSGITLYINTEVQFDEVSRIVVNRGGTLNLTDCKLTSLNECGMWQGIEVWGNDDSSSYSLSNGRVQLVGSVYIENAHIGILSGKRNYEVLCDSAGQKFDLDFSGGLVVAQPSDYSATFTDNGIDIEFTRKTNTDGIANRLNNLWFRCSALNDEHYLSTHVDPYPNIHNPWAGYANLYQRSAAGILMENLRGPNIRDCLFRNKQNGILSFDSKYNVFDCDFRNATYGIRIENTNTSVDNRHEIANCSFDSIPGVANAHGCGIRIRGGRFDYIRNNTFGTQISLQAINNISIRSDHASSFSIGENLLYNFKTGIFVRNTGLSSSYVGALSPYWLGNRYTRCRTNIQTLGDNSRLKLKCNMCNNDAPLLYQVNFNNSSGNLSQQGSPAPSFGSTNFKMKFGAGNEFAPPLTGRKRIESVSPYRYYRQSNPAAVIPETYTSTGFINVQPISSTYIEKTNNATACPSPLGVVPAEPAINFALFPYTILDSLESANEELRYEYDDRMENLDSGATVELLEAIYTVPPSDELADILLYHSPLSDTVLIALTEQNPLSDDDYATVLLTNLPVSDHVEPWFYVRVLKLNEDWQTTLFNVQAYNANAICPTAIVRQMDENSVNRGLWQNSIVTALTDTLNNDPETALALLQNDTAVSVLQILAGNCLLNGEYQAVERKLDTIALVTTVLDEWITFTGFVEEHYSNGGNYNNLDSTDIEYIRSFAYACPENSATPFAQALLYLLFREETPDCDEFENRIQLSHTEQSQSVTGSTCDAIAYAYYPSPVTGKASIPYYLPDGTEGWMVIADAAGHDIAVYELQTGRNELQANVSGYAAGIYFYGIRTRAGNCLFHQMVIVK